MMRRFFLKLLSALAIPAPDEARRKKLDHLISDYNRRFEAVYNISETTVCYERDAWDGIREAFSKIIAEAIK